MGLRSPTTLPTFSATTSSTLHTHVSPALTPPLSLSPDQMDTQRPLHLSANPSLDLRCLSGLFREISLADFYARQPRELDPWTKFIKGKPSASSLPQNRLTNTLPNQPSHSLHPQSPVTGPTCFCLATLPICSLFFIILFF